MRYKRDAKRRCGAEQLVPLHLRTCLQVRIGRRENQKGGIKRGVERVDNHRKLLLRGEFEHREGRTRVGEESGIQAMGVGHAHNRQACSRVLGGRGKRVDQLRDQFVIGTVLADEEKKKRSDTEEQNKRYVAG